MSNSRDEVSRRRRRVSYEQLESLWEFLNAHRDLAVGYNKSAQARDYTKRMWVSVSEALNSLGEGANKDWKGWSTYWVDYKAKLKRKVAAIRISQTRTGGGPSEVSPLTEVEKKFVCLLGEGFASGLPNIQVDPFPTLPNEQEREQSEGEGLQLPTDSLQLEEEVPMQQQEEVELTLEQQEEPTSQLPESVAHSPSRVVRRRPGRRQAMSQIMARQRLVEVSEERLMLARENAETWRQTLQTLNKIASAVDKIGTALVGSGSRRPEPRDEGSPDC